MSPTCRTFPAWRASQGSSCTVNNYRSNASFAGKTVLVVKASFSGDAADQQRMLSKLSQSDMASSSAIMTLPKFTSMRQVSKGIYVPLLLCQSALGLAGILINAPVDIDGDSVIQYQDCDHLTMH